MKKKKRSKEHLFIFEPAKTSTGDRMHLNKISLSLYGNAGGSAHQVVLLHFLRYSHSIVCGDESCISVTTFFSFARKKKKKYKISFLFC